MKDLIKVENPLFEPLGDKGFEMYRGWSEELAEELVVHSREPDMLRWVPRDASARFRDTDAAHEWYLSKKRTVYALSRRAILGGVIWFGREPREEYEAEYTFAIRMYDDARGQGAAGPFMATAHADFMSRADSTGAVWLETDHDNIPARKLYERQGYAIADQTRDGRIIMVRPKGTD